MKFNAKKAENDYITDNSMSYRSLAEKYKVNPSTITKYAKKGEWVRKREEYQTQVAQKAIKKRAERESDKLSKLSSATDEAIDIVAEFISKYDDDSSFKYKNFKDIVLMLDKLISVQRNVKGILTVKEEKSLELAKEKLELDKAKVGTGKDDDGQTGIVLIPDVIDEACDNIVIEGETDA